MSNKYIPKINNLQLYFFVKLHFLLLCMVSLSFLIIDENTGQEQVITIMDSWTISIVT
jgi:hypothetical protein